jgi:transglutaminase-like putative cysteine protease
MDKIMIWVYENLEKRPTVSIPSAVQVLEMKVGDCNEHSVLTAALLRAAGVPTRLAVGVLYFEDRFYYHAWVEAYWGKWLAFDPVLGQSPADATHIRFMTGGLSRQVEMVRVIGRLEVQILEVK